MPSGGPAGALEDTIGERVPFVSSRFPRPRRDRNGCQLPFAHTAEQGRERRRADDMAIAITEATCDWTVSSGAPASTPGTESSRNATVIAATALVMFTPRRALPASDHRASKPCRPIARVEPTITVTGASPCSGLGIVSSLSTPEVRQSGYAAGRR
jgi:hypothetical protein